MDFADLETMWRSPHNRPSVADVERQKLRLVADLRRRRRGNLVFILLSGLPLVIFTALVVRHVFWPDPDHTPLDLQREWAIIPLYALPWIGWFFSIRLHRRHCLSHQHFESSISASVVALLDENRSERTRYKFIGGLLLAGVLILPLLVLQLRAVGKAGDEIFVPFLVLFPALLLGIVLWMTVYYRRKLLPRKAELEALVATYDDTADDRR